MTISRSLKRAICLYALLVIDGLCFLYSSFLAAPDANKGHTIGNGQRELQVF